VLPSKQWEIQVCWNVGRDLICWTVAGKVLYSCAPLNKKVLLPNSVLGYIKWILSLPLVHLYPNSSLIKNKEVVYCQAHLWLCHWHRLIAEGILDPITVWLLQHLPSHKAHTSIISLGLSLSTVVLNSRDWPRKKWRPKF